MTSKPEGARILIVEDHERDMGIASEVALAAGFSHVDCVFGLVSVNHLFETALGGQRPLPDAMLVDLDLGPESGFEVLRIRYTTPRLKAIPIVVWSQLGDENREICGLFAITAYVPKWLGVPALRAALESLVPSQRTADDIR